MAAQIELFLADEAAAKRLGEDIALALRPGDLIALNGDLGTGKTTLARALIRAMAGDPVLEVPSPTFTLVQAYDTRIPLYHFDLYRLSDSEELEELGLSEALQFGAALVEWPERAKLSAGVTVHLEHEGDGRRAIISGEVAALARVARSLAIRDFLGANGWGEAARRYLLGDASARAYETVDLPGEPRRILMNSPELVLGPPVRDGKPYAIIAHTAQTVSAFVAIDHALRDAGVSVPEIYASDLAQGFLLVEHLGSDTFLEDGKPVAERYAAAAQLLAYMHRHDWPTEIEVGGARHSIPPFDREAMLIEVSLLMDWYLPYMRGAPASDALKAEFEALWNAALDRIATAETSLLMRDYHSPNIVWRATRTGNDRLGILDFQDAMIGPTAYDLASLAMDARVTIPDEIETETVEAYASARAAAGAFDRRTFALAYATMAAHRNSKILGGFVRLDRRDGKPIYLKHLPRIREYVRRAFRHPQLAELRDFYERNGLLSEDAA
ncbi:MULTISPECIES: tRNA (adenosine(37)-N6)-threonylcarbamoyltransferase complex ATPase subunit type 1 TsaE [Mesorhizobium]|uniref:tRNA threonylcarbamoyladenosine biosynthesis protein TsaE n=1 Tax=Mesorhizobium denitrificans TaxID=2294114 RepID=A0A371XHL1_9HYPH|nr:MULTISPECIES: tRNA (adenosine(37)-N6)-threonylcarbamoyltransferase complex ATPase subunit type 1 TsaE [Mesorhizobium]RFC68701.1 tRNA (adenosine(37)-N6)-threonylcarbamoyltransferase complex ATPase subunit type 1 TsaE [Mesorhizobium denitrificans]